MPLIGPLLGLIGSAMPSIVGIFTKKQETNAEIQKMQAQAALAATESGMRILEKQTDIDLEEAKKSMPDQIITNNIIIDSIQTMFRPLCAYGMTSFYVFCRIKGMPVNDFDQEVLSAILFFYFGSRAFTKKNK